MADQMQRVCPGLPYPHITPFGVDSGVFAPRPMFRDPGCITVGTVKKLEYGYGIDILVRAFAQARKRLLQGRPGDAARLRLLIVGGGTGMAALGRLRQRLGLSGVAKYSGASPP